MSLSPAIDGGFPTADNGTAYDMAPAGILTPDNYSTAMNQQMAFQIPLGSQLNLLNAQNAGNEYMNSARTQDKRLGSLQNVLPGYDLNHTRGNGGSYLTFGSAYGMA